MGTCARLGSRWARLPHAGLAGECALCAFLLCKSCFIRDIDLCSSAMHVKPVNPYLLAVSIDKIRCDFSDALLRPSEMWWYTGRGVKPRCLSSNAPRCSDMYGAYVDDAYRLDPSSSALAIDAPTTPVRHKCASASA